MSTLAYPASPTVGIQSAERLNGVQRCALAVGIIEIPLQLDKYFMFHQADADFGAVGGFNVSVTSVCLAFLYFNWASGAAVARSQTLPDRFRHPQRWIMGWPMIMYLMLVAFSTLSASLPILSLFDLFLGIQAFALFFYIANRVRSRDDLVFCVLVLATTLLIQSLFVFVTSVLVAPGEERKLGPLSLMVWEDGRPAGTMQSAVLAGSVLAILWLPVASLSLCPIKRLRWLIVAMATTAGLLAILMTQTRGAILTTFVGGVIIGVGMLLRRWLPMWTMVAACMLAAISVFPIARVIENRIHGDDGGSAEARKHLSAIAVEMISDRPLFGYGAGNCHLAGRRYADRADYRAEWYYTIHCKYLLVWIETGIFGLIAFLAMLGRGVWHGWTTWKTADRLIAPIGLALVAAIAGHMLHMLVDVFNSRTQVQMLWVILGVAAASFRIAQSTLRGAA